MIDTTNTTVGVENRFSTVLCEIVATPTDNGTCLNSSQIYDDDEE